MAGKLKYLAILFFTIPLFLGIAAASAFAPQANDVNLVSPAACPAAGCPGGQRLNLRADFNTSIFDSRLSPNLQLCVYALINWSATTLETAANGNITGQAYTPTISNCESSPDGYNLLGGSTAALPANAFGDSLAFAFRLGVTATTPGSVLVRVLEQDTAGHWVRTGQTFSAIPVTATATTVFVANDSAGCSTNSPCYVNSGDDLPQGLGTALKDAVDSSTSPITIKVLGHYLIKKNTVVINKQHALTGVNDAGITYQGGDCSQPMLKVTSGASLTNLTIDSGACSSPLRNLIQVESATPVSIESNDLTNGNDAIHVGPANTADLDVRFNHIQNNTGYGIYLEEANNGQLDAVANNIFNNRSGAQVECNGAAKGAVDHNFWGAGGTGTAISKCTFTDAKRLGAVIQHNNGPGVSSLRLTASSTLSRVFNDQVGFLFAVPASATAQVLDFYVVNHGANIPFTGAQPQVTPCSNYWDIFQADAITPDPAATLELHFKYNLSASCISTINLAQFCGQTPDSSRFPLFWYDNNTNNWTPTGRNPGGQPTTCDTSNTEIKVVVNTNTTGHQPTLNDLSRLPFVVQLPWQGVAPVISDFTGQTGSQKVTLNWATTSQVNGFYVQRSTLPDNGFAVISPLILPETSQTYEYVDEQGLVNNTTYYYRLQILNPDQTTALTGVISVTPIPPTATPTPTVTMTFTRTIAPSSTRTRTPYPTTIFFYRSPTPTRTFTLTPTSPFKTVTNTLQPSPTEMGTLFLSPTLTSIGSVFPTGTSTPGAATQLIAARLTRTAQAFKSVTPTPKPVAKPFTLSLTAVLAILAGVAGVAGLVIYLLRNRLKFPA